MTWSVSLVYVASWCMQLTRSAVLSAAKSAADEPAAVSRLVRHTLTKPTHAALVRAALAALGPMLGYRDGAGQGVPRSLVQWHADVIAWDWFAAGHTLDDLVYCQVS